MDVLKIIKRIEQRLIELNMTKAEFYKKSGISSASLCQWKSGKYVPSEKKLNAAAAVLGVSYEYLIDDKPMDIMLQRILELVGTKHGAAQELVRAIGCPKNAVTDWKAGRSRSYKEYAPQIADYYGVSLDWLSGLTDERTTKKASSEDEAEGDRIANLRKRLEALSEEDLDKLIAMMDVLGM